MELMYFDSKDPSVSRNQCDLKKQTNLHLPYNIEMDNVRNPK